MRWQLLSTVMLLTQQPLKIIAWEGAYKVQGRNGEKDKTGFVNSSTPCISGRKI